MATGGESANGGSSTSAGVVKSQVTGTLLLLGVGAPGRSLTTPGGICHLWDFPVYSEFTGDFSGPVTFLEKQNFRCDFTHAADSGPMTGTLTWRGQTGEVSGQWTTNCKADPTTPVGLSCDGTLNLRGSGGLEGVQFHVKWGPGWFPFPYSGTAFAK
jgi:hypothetical protein